MPASRSTFRLSATVGAALRYTGTPGNLLSGSLNFTYVAGSAYEQRPLTRDPHSALEVRSFLSTPDPTVSSLTTVVSSGWDSRFRQLPCQTIEPEPVSRLTGFLNRAESFCPQVQSSSGTSSMSVRVEISKDSCSNLLSRIERFLMRNDHNRCRVFCQTLVQKGRGGEIFR